MTVGSSRDEFPLTAGITGGALAYLLGVAFVVASHRLGLHPDHGIWTRHFTAGEYLVVHSGIHLPVWRGIVRWEVLPQTVVLFALLTVAGFLGARSTGTDEIGGFRAGSAVVAGYLTAASFAALYASVTVEALSPEQLFAPTLLVGGFVPLAFGGLGGVLAGRIVSK